MLLTNLLKKQHYILHVKKGHIDIVVSFVSHGANVNITNEDGYTPLHIACKKRLCFIIYNILK